MEVKVSLLREIENESKLVQEKLKMFETKKLRILTMVASNKWLENVFQRPLLTFDKFGANKLRTSIGLCGEELMKLLLRLDQIQSDGIEEVREMRRNLVKFINGELLPLADEALVQAQAILTLSNRVRRLENIRRERLRQALTNPEIPKSETDSQDSTDIEEESLSDDVSIDSETGSQTKEFPKESLRKLESSENHSPKYRIIEDSDFAIVDIILPLTEHAEELSFRIRTYENELIVKGKSFELPLQISPRGYVLDDSRVKIKTDQHLQIYIPKRKFSQYYHNPRYINPFESHRSSYQPRYYGNSFYDSFF